MAFDSSEVIKVARLARLRVTEDERESLAGQLRDILELVAQMNRVDTDGVLPMAHPLDQHQRLRDDHVSEPECREELQAGAPSASDGFYLVPRFLD